MHFFTRHKPPFKGILEVYELPYETEAEFLRYWPRLTEREKRRMLAMRYHNIVTQRGINNINAFYQASGSTVNGFSKYFAVGTGALNGVALGDTSLATEVFRKVPTSTSVVGNSIIITTLFLGTEGGHSGTNPVTYTNSGLFGGAATSTLGSGDINTHALYSYTKAYNSSINNTYRIVRT